MKTLATIIKDAHQAGMMREDEAVIIDRTVDTMTLQFEDGSIIRLKMTTPTGDGQGVNVREIPLS